MILFCFVFLKLMKNQEKHEKISTSLVSRSELVGSLRERGRERERQRGRGRERERKEKEKEKIEQARACMHAEPRRCCNRLLF